MIFLVLQQHLHFLEELEVAKEELRNARKVMQCSTFVWRLDDMKESLKCLKKVRWMGWRIYLDTLGTRWDVDKSLWFDSGSWIAGCNVLSVELQDGFPILGAVLFTCLTVMNSATWIVCARIMLTWLKRWKVVRRTHAWCGGKFGKKHRKYYMKTSETTNQTNN